MRNCFYRVGATTLFLLIAMMAFAGKGKVQPDRVETRVESKAIKAPVEYHLVRSVGPGRLVKVQGGKPGAMTRTIEIVFRDGKAVSRRTVREERTEPTPTVFHMGRASRGFQTSRGAFKRSRVLTMSATAYDPSPRTIGPGATGRTRMGMRATFGMVAVDPRVIPLGSLVFVEGYGFAIASDTGGAIKGMKIDLCFDSRAQALAFGRRTVRVHVLRTR